MRHGVNFWPTSSILPKAICQETPNLSSTQPYLSLHGYLSKGINIFPSRIRDTHTSSVSASVSQITKKDAEGFTWYFGPPFKAINFSPARLKITATGFSDVMVDSLKTEQ